MIRAYSGLIIASILLWNGIYGILSRFVSDTAQFFDMERTVTLLDLLNYFQTVLGILFLTYLFVGLGKNASSPIVETGKNAYDSTQSLLNGKTLLENRLALSLINGLTFIAVVFLIGTLMGAFAEDSKTFLQTIVKIVSVGLFFIISGFFTKRLSTLTQKFSTLEKGFVELGFLSFAFVSSLAIFPSLEVFVLDSLMKLIE